MNKQELESLVAEIIKEVVNEQYSVETAAKAIADLFEKHPVP